MISLAMKAYANKLMEVSGVKRVDYYQRIPEDNSGWTEIYGTDIDFILVTWQNVRANHSNTQSYLNSTWYDVDCSVMYMKEYKQSPIYEKSSQFGFDLVVDRLLTKFNSDVTIIQIDSADKLRIPKLTEVTIPNGGVIESAELNKLVHVLNFDQIITFMY